MTRGSPERCTRTCNTLPKGSPELFSIQVVNRPQTFHHRQTQGPGSSIVIGRKIEKFPYVVSGVGAELTRVLDYRDVILDEFVVLAQGLSTANDLPL